MMFLKRLINSVLYRFGYQIVRAETRQFRPIDVLDLAIHKVNAQTPDLFFLQVGANDGMTCDPLRKYILMYDWCGLLIEPNPNAYNKLISNYPGACLNRLQFENVAIAHTAGEMILYVVDESGRDDSALFASFSRSHIAKISRRDCAIKEVAVQSTTLMALLEKSCIDRVDILQIDTEGFDYEVIKLLNFDLIKPQLIHYEHIHLSKDDQWRCSALLESNGYNLHRQEWDTVALLKTINE